MGCLGWFEESIQWIAANHIGMIAELHTMDLECRNLLLILCSSSMEKVGWFLFLFPLTVSCTFGDHSPYFLLFVFSMCDGTCVTKLV